MTDAMDAPRRIRELEERVSRDETEHRKLVERVAALERRLEVQQMWQVYYNPNHPLDLRVAPAPSPSNINTTGALPGSET